MPRGPSGRLRCPGGSVKKKAVPAAAGLLCRLFLPLCGFREWKMHFLIICWS